MIEQVDAAELSPGEFAHRVRAVVDDLQEVVTQAIAPFRDRDGKRFRVEGPDVRLNPRMSLAVAMALQELATNAVKYGALSNPTGVVTIAWTLSAPNSHADQLNFYWQEQGGPPVKKPTRRGFGSRLIERSLARDLDGTVDIAFEPTGVVCRIEAPLA